VTRKSCSMLLSNIYEHARPSCKLILPMCTFAFHSFLSVEPIPVGIDRQLGEFSLVSLCGSCEFYQQQERVRRTARGGGGASPQKVFPYPTWEVCTPLKNLNLIWINDSSVIEIKILNYSKYDWKQGFWTKENQKSHNFLGASPHYQLCLQTPTAACSAALRPPLNFGHPPEPNLKIRLWERRLRRGQVK
jgi:hypothetical protein